MIEEKVSQCFCVDPLSMFLTMILIIFLFIVMYLAGKHDRIKEFRE